MTKSISLCPACDSCPSVEIDEREVRIGEAGNLAKLTPAEWNVLVRAIKSGELRRSRPTSGEHARRPGDGREPSPAAVLLPLKTSTPCFLRAQAVVERTPSSGLYLWVLEQNTDAQAFYAARGGTCVGKEFALPPGGDPRRLNGAPVKLRYIWPCPSKLLAGA